MIRTKAKGGRLLKGGLECNEVNFKVDAKALTTDMAVSEFKCWIEFM